ncbi:MAG: hypothetical protein KGL12_00120 [Rhodospirillales bacterium]|nr:hypothetical protein [Rhodospirillales bacterium]
MRPFARLLGACALSLLLYWTAFACVLDRPLTLGFIRAQIAARLAEGAAARGPKLVILAGSNGPYSHRCQVIGTMLHRPCINAGVAVGIGLDTLFLDWEALLHPGDAVYLPMEEAQYARGRAASGLGPDATILFRHDWRKLARLGPRRWLGAAFSGDLNGAIMSGIETALVAGGFHDPRAMTEGASNRWGDHVGHSPALGAIDRPALAAAQPWHASARQVRNGFGSREIATFLDWARNHGITAIGGLPTGFADSPIPPATLTAIAALYRAHGAGFLVLANHSRYPRADFFDTPDHLSEPCQIAHSVLVARALAPLLGVMAGPAPAIPLPAGEVCPRPPGEEGGSIAFALLRRH